MLEEYLCLGGTEIINNQRTYGYATSAGCPLTWFHCEPCDSIRAAVNDWRYPTYRTEEVGHNLAANPSMEGVSGSPGTPGTVGVTFTQPTGSAGALEIRHVGSSVEFWIRCSDPLTTTPNLSWSGTVNGGPVGGILNLPQGFGARQVGAWTLSAAPSQQVSFSIVNSGTFGLGGPTNAVANLILPTPATGQVTGWAGKGVVTPTLSASMTHVHSGIQSLKVTAGAGTNGTFGTGLNVSGLTVGREYTLSGWVLNESASTVAATVANIAYGTSTGASSEWVRLTMTFTATATTHQIGFDGAAPSAQGQVFYVDDVMLEEGDLSDYFDGDTVEPTSADEIFWTGTAHASASVWHRQVLSTPGQVDAPLYEAQHISDAPWYDSDVPWSARFYGAFALTIENLNSSTRTATVTEGILDGGVAGLTRHATREMRARVLLVADGDDALEYGLAWLNAALETSECETHGSACGAVDMQFFAYCPQSPDPLAPPDNDGSDLWDAEVHAPRYMHNVSVISGPLVEQKLKSNNHRHVGYIVEWTMVAGTPWVFSVTSEVGISPSSPIVVQDTPFNLMPHPSAELSSGTVVVQTNYAVNPSVETDATGWATAAGGITPTPTGSRTTEVASIGTASFKAAVTTTNSGTDGTISAYQDVTLPAYISGQRFSASMWGFAAVLAGTASLTNLRCYVEWRTASAAVSTSEVGTGPVAGGAMSMPGLSRPATATVARVYMTVNVASWAVGAQINLFADALALTLP